MLTVHGFWSRGRGLCLWAEDSERPVKSPSQAMRSARPHPFAATAEQLATVHSGKPGTATLLLPSLRTAPLDSPELTRVSPRPSPTKGPALLRWSVPIATFDPAAALAVLEEPDGSVRYGASVPDGASVRHGASIRYGASVRFLAELHAFARELAERGRVLPEVDQHDDAGYAGWRPVLQGPDVVAMQELVSAMPPAVRAEAASSTDTRGQSPSDLVSDALHRLVDVAVREKLAATPLLPRRRGRPPKQVPVAERWLQALTSPDGRFEAEPDDIADLRRALAPWAEFGTGQTGPARATFRLTDANPAERTLFDQSDQDDAADTDDTADTDDAAEPADQATFPDARWRLEFLLQSVEDPSLLVPAEQVWAGGDGLHRWLARPDELLLAELGRASAVYPELSGALRHPRPSALELDADGAYDFLSTRAALLDQAGFG
ncbi:MAG: ATP-dependent helicase, partial [Actinomycetota bacterium]